MFTSVRSSPTRAPEWFRGTIRRGGSRGDRRADGIERRVHENAPRRRRLLTRDACALVNLLIERYRNGEALAAVRKRDLFESVKKLNQLSLELPERAHASLLLALCLEFLKDETFVTDEQIKAVCARECATASRSVRAARQAGNGLGIFKDLTNRK